jgi:hypothetical protein
VFRSGFKFRDRAIMIPKKAMNHELLTMNHLQSAKLPKFLAGSKSVGVIVFILTGLLQQHI